MIRTGSVEYLVLEIARLLRSSGIAVSVPEVKDCLHLLKAFGGKLDKYDFYRLVNTTMIKTAWGEDYVLWLVELYYGPDPELGNDRLQVLSSKTTSLTGERLADGSGQGLPVNLLVEAVLHNQIELIVAMLKGLRLTLEPDCEDREKALHDFQRQSGWLETAESLEHLRQQGRIAAADYLEAQATMKNWKILLQEEVEQQLLRNMSREYLLTEMKKYNPRTAGFLDSNSSQESSMSREIQKLGRKLAVRKGRRRQVGGARPAARALSACRKACSGPSEPGGFPFRWSGWNANPLDRIFGFYVICPIPSAGSVIFC
jgi:hypothetical protein